MMHKYYVFRKLIDFVADNSEVTNANMNNYAGNIEITGRDAEGSTITITVELKEEEKDA